MRRSESFLDFPSEEILALWRRFLQNYLYRGEHRGEQESKGQGEGLCVHTQPVNTHTEPYKDPSGEPTLKVNAAPGCN